MLTTTMCLQFTLLNIYLLPLWMSFEGQSRYAKSSLLVQICDEPIISWIMLIA
jgi:hypothetical protein